VEAEPRLLKAHPLQQALELSDTTQNAGALTATAQQPAVALMRGKQQTPITKSVTIPAAERITQLVKTLEEEHQRSDTACFLSRQQNIWRF